MIELYIYMYIQILREREREREREMMMMMMMTVSSQQIKAIFTIKIKPQNIYEGEGVSRGVVANCDILIREFELRSRYYVQF